MMSKSEYKRRVALNAPVAWRVENANPPGGHVIFQQFPAALKASGQRVDELLVRQQPLLVDEIVECAGRAVAEKIVSKQSITPDDWIEFARNIERAHGIGT